MISIRPCSPAHGLQGHVLSFSKGLVKGTRSGGDAQQPVRALLRQDAKYVEHQKKLKPRMIAYGLCATAGWVHSRGMGTNACCPKQSVKGVVTRNDQIKHPSIPSLEFVPNTTPNSLLIQMTVLDQVSEMLLQRVSADTRQFDRIADRDRAHARGQIRRSAVTARAR